jgi:hypothetical protein
VIYGVVLSAALGVCGGGRGERGLITQYSKEKWW